MGIFDSLLDLGEAVVNTAFIPIAVVKDVVTLNPGENTVNQVEKVAEKILDAGDDLVS